MSTIVSIELLLDSDTEERVRSDWQRLADAGLSSLGAHTAPSNRPHITLLVRPQLVEVPFAEAAALLPLPLVLEAPVLFRHGDRGVLAWGVRPDEELLGLHRSVHAAVPAGADAPHTAPGQWTPHVTLARRLRVESVERALAVIGPPRTGSGVALRRWDAASRTVTPLAGS
jgi:2'-5' RNA ligase